MNRIALALAGLMFGFGPEASAQGGSRPQCECSTPDSPEYTPNNMADPALVDLAIARKA